MSTSVEQLQAMSVADLDAYLDSLDAQRATLKAEALRVMAVRNEKLKAESVADRSAAHSRATRAFELLRAEEAAEPQRAKAGVANVKGTVVK